ncbi:MAG: hypothetical protein NT125_08405 [Candidatus Bipolaricaulota bacterium]|nr:hypothetical protein [Candidatus Bipolaricaulota bacterium]
MVNPISMPQYLPTILIHHVDHANMLKKMGFGTKLMWWLIAVPILGPAPLWAGMIAYTRYGVSPDVVRLCSNCILIFFAGGVVGSSVYTLVANDRTREMKFVFGVLYLVALFVIGLGMYIPDVQNAVHNGGNDVQLPFGTLIAESALTGVALLYALVVEYLLERGKSAANWVVVSRNWGVKF